jgi:hypothetical protein
VGGATHGGAGGVTHGGAGGVTHGGAGGVTHGGAGGVAHGGTGGSDLCERGLKDCSATPLPNNCYVAECNPATGACLAKPRDGIACDDGDPCTSGDSCQGGLCGPGKAVLACNSGDKCCPAGCSSPIDNDCQSTQLVLDAVNRGWWSATGDHDSFNDNTFTGYCANCTYVGNYCSYFSFDLRKVPGKVASVTLILELEHFIGTDPAETLEVSDVSTAASTLENATHSATIFDDLDGGKLYGTYTALPSEVGSKLSIPLNAQAVADVNAALGGDFSVGLSLTSITQSAIEEGIRFSATNEMRIDQLVLTLR